MMTLVYLRGTSRSTIALGGSGLLMEASEVLVTVV